jgi:hypothetical protein
MPPFPSKATAVHTVHIMYRQLNRNNQQTLQVKLAKQHAILTPVGGSVHVHELRVGQCKGGQRKTLESTEAGQDPNAATKIQQRNTTVRCGALADAGTLR